MEFVLSLFFTLVPDAEHEPLLFHSYYLSQFDDRTTFLLHEKLTISSKPMKFLHVQT